MHKILYILIGSKGSGKTYNGNRIEQIAGTKFLRVESLWLKLAEGEDGWTESNMKSTASF
jgi:ATP-dependent protease HslVU (ClpYQ) ATPase subunit